MMHTSRTKAVLFDVDGTLAETEGDGHRVAFNAAMSAAGIDTHWDVDVYGELLLVAGGRQRFEHFFVNYESMPIDEARALAAELHVEKTELFVEMVESGQIDPRPGVPEFVHDLQHGGITTGIVTTGRRAWVEPLVTHLLGSTAFNKMATVVTGDDVLELKPSPEAYRLAMTRLQLDPSMGIAIEDSLNGVVAAKAAGMLCVAAPSYYNRSDDFGEADLVIDEFVMASLGRQTSTLLHNSDFRDLLYGNDHG